MKSDDLIISQLKSEEKHEKGYASLMELYGDSLYNQIYRLTKDQQDTNDVFQNTLIKVFKGIDGFQQKSSLYSWLYRIAYNESMTFLKKKSRYTKRYVELAEEAYQFQYETNLEPQMILKILNEAIATLPERQKLVFELRYFNEKPYEEIARMLGVSQGSLKASYHIAVKKIETHINNIELVNYES